MSYLASHCVFCKAQIRSPPKSSAPPPAPSESAACTPPSTDPSQTPPLSPLLFWVGQQDWNMKFSTSMHYCECRIILGAVSLCAKLFPNKHNTVTATLTDYQLHLMSQSRQMDLPVVGPIATIMAAPTASEEDPTIRAAAALFTPEGEKKIKILSLPDCPLTELI